MTWRLGSVILVALLVAICASQAQAATRTRLQTAMQRYALCRVHNKAARVAGGISAITPGKVTYEILLTNKAALVVNAGSGQRHRVRWITSHGVVEHLFRFVHLRNVAPRLGAMCR